MTKLKTSIRKIVIFGPQGSGKGTQAEFLSKELGIPWISTGNIYRQNIEEQTELGKLASQYSFKGKLVPDKITNQLVAKRLKEKDAQEGFVLDGYPRNEIQAEALDKMAKIDAVFEIAISDKESIRRISGRRVCACGMTYHIDFNPPQQQGICDQCGKKLFQRKDDQEEITRQRLAIYHQNTEILLKRYWKQKILIRINGEQSIPAVKEEIFQKINKSDFIKE
ncbi:MAG: adenylate kinase [Candidatus Kerfeldbacteria bacterium CG08_land_8_20_14_0_20_40_16]|uniref:Adenylate kinase n=1 Tax=Candidatus Kerfeldbacteria bacterium CG08_land_8_20_14_0_20_40_16 TaxID=2014244 RepID=A0A2H0YUT8_9BACT|nr:MAG: adenylate kinase [Candidatus Kerfeldbacteria bacterium CG08_land_8_20_14_0_20_40_16]